MRHTSTIDLSSYEDPTGHSNFVLPYGNSSVTLQLFVQMFSTGVSWNGSKVLWIAQVVDKVFESDLVRSVFQASLPVLE